MEFLGQVAEAVEAVAEAFLELLDWIVEFAVGLITQAWQIVIDPIRIALAGTVTDLGASMDVIVDEHTRSGTVSADASQRFEKIFFGDLFVAVSLVSVAFVVAILVLGSVLLPFAFLVGLIAVLAFIAIIATIATVAIPSFPPDIGLLPTPALDADSVFGATRDYVIREESRHGGGSHLTEIFDIVALVFDLLATALLAIFVAANAEATGIGLFIIGLIFSIFAALVSVAVLANVWYRYHHGRALDTGFYLDRPRSGS